MISFAPVDKNSNTGWPSFKVQAEQRSFVEANLGEFLRSWSDDIYLHCFLILEDSRPVGFFALDFEPDRHRAYADTSERFCVLRNYLIDRSEQGKGFAARSLELLPEFVRTNFPGTHKIYLTVNEKNAAARGLYVKHGFTELPRRFLGGRAGPQAVMVFPL